MSDPRNKMRGRASHANFIGIERLVADSAAFKSLPPIARALYLDLRRQFLPWRNGDISAADGILQQYGWSHSTIHKYLKILVKHQLLIRTRNGGIGTMSRITTLYAFADQAIAEIAGKGIKAAPPSIAYKTYVPAEKLRRTRNRRAEKK